MRYGWVCKRMMAEGLRTTQARMLILNILEQKAKQHLSAEEIFLLAHRINPAIGFATVYRTLNLLTRLGVIQKLDFGDGKARYEMIQETEDIPHHHHLICTECGKIIDYTEFVEEEKDLISKTEKRLTEKYKFEIKNHILNFYGICNECKERR